MYKFKNKSESAVFMIDINSDNYNKGGNRYEV